MRKVCKNTKKQIAERLPIQIGPRLPKQPPQNHHEPHIKKTLPPNLTLKKTPTPNPLRPLPQTFLIIPNLPINEWGVHSFNKIQKPNKIHKKIQHILSDLKKLQIWIFSDIGYNISIYQIWVWMGHLRIV